MVFLAGAILLIVVNQLLGYGKEFQPLNTPWFVWAILLWTFFFLIHLINVFLLGSFMNKAWEQKQLDRLVAKQKKRIEKLHQQVEKEYPLPAQNSTRTSPPANTSTDSSL
ncbi:2TM domain-containing protein [Croceiramulus getboli]|nr:2TM domain-containing protein [Flavobacteriaceae bacterium YJPT1-3]